MQRFTRAPSGGAPRSPGSVSLGNASVKGAGIADGFHRNCGHDGWKVDLHGGELRKLSGLNRLADFRWHSAKCKQDVHPVEPRERKGGKFKAAQYTAAGKPEKEEN